jgi:hypothetical protein
MKRGVWIPISEGLPEMSEGDFGAFGSEYLLVLTKYEDVKFAEFYRYDDEALISVRTESDGFYIPLETITHYMYIPETPKG